MVNTQPHLSRLQSFSRVAGAVVVLIGCLVLIGWIFDIVVLMSVVPGLTMMNPMTAVGFVLAGASLFLISDFRFRILDSAVRHPRSAVALVCALSVAVIGVVRLAGYLFGCPTQ
jgi:methyl-accepting chemotaxis protein